MSLVVTVLGVGVDDDGVAKANDDDDDDNYDDADDDEGMMDVFAHVPDQPRADAGVDSIGEMNGYLNSCRADARSCASSQNDDERHFIAPWAYEGTRTEAMRALVEVAVSGRWRRRMKTNARAVEAKVEGKGETTAMIAMGEEEEEEEGENARNARRMRDERANVTANVAKALGFKVDRGESDERNALSFAARVEEYDETRGYVRLVLAPRARAKSSGTRFGDAGDDARGGYFDAEFLFLEDDEIVDVRVAQRESGVAPGRALRLSYDDGITFYDNIAALRAEELRIAVGWELIPVIAAFDPKWSDKKRMWFEKAFDFASGRRAEDDGDDLRYMRDTLTYNS